MGGVCWGEVGLDGVGWGEVRWWGWQGGMWGRAGEGGRWVALEGGWAEVVLEGVNCECGGAGRVEFWMGRGLCGGFKSAPVGVEKSGVLGVGGG